MRVEEAPEVERLRADNRDLNQECEEYNKILCTQSRRIEELEGRLDQIRRDATQAINAHRANEYEPVARRLYDIMKGAERAAEEQEPCEHEWVDPSNERVQAGTWRLCLKCMRLQDSPALAAEGQEPTSHAARQDTHPD